MCRLAIIWLNLFYYTVLWPGLSQSDGIIKEWEPLADLSKTWQLNQRKIEPDNKRPLTNSYELSLVGQGEPWLEINITYSILRAELYKFQRNFADCSSKTHCFRACSADKPDYHCILKKLTQHDRAQQPDTTSNTTLITLVNLPIICCCLRKKLFSYCEILYAAASIII